EMEALLALANGHMRLGNFVEAYRFHMQAYEAARIQSDPVSVISVLMQFGQLYAALSDFEKAADYYFQALSLSRDQHEEKLTAEILSLLGDTYRQLEKNDLSLDYSNQALEKFKNLAVPSDISMILIQIGKINMNLGNFAEAIRNDREALILAMQAEDPWYISLAYNDLGWNYLQIGDYETSLVFNQMALDYRRINDIHPLMGSSLVNIGYLYLSWNKPDSALVYFIEAENYLLKFNSISARELLKNNYDYLAQLYTGLKNYREALSCYQKYMSIEKELATIASNREITHLQIKAEIDKLTSENEAIDKIQKLELKRQKIVINFILSLTILLLIIVAILYNRYLIRREKQQELREHNQVLTDINSKLNHEIEERKKAEKESYAHSDHLKQINRILRHDLTNDLATLKSGISLYSRNRDDSILQEISGRIEKSVSLIEQMKKFENFMSEHSDLRVFQVREILEQFKDKYKDIEIEIKGNCRVMADESLSSVFDNVIRNAIEHGQTPKIDIELKASDNICEIKIHDFGRGIPAEIRNYIFDEGFTTGSSKHSGMGLYIVKKAMESFDGSVFVMDNKPQGSTFVFILHKAI
ncbi:MAG: tetratricopeptide repeat-containing sensor histidine kinase, partial [Candidatus Cloacimonetes bacterium]|nr:tetratricopeptide repeat-containing sensor histidine kinase [Candidatus Cloacimonadota bacterium]